MFVMKALVSLSSSLFCYVTLVSVNLNILQYVPFWTELNTQHLFEYNYIIYTYFSNMLFLLLSSLD